ncbi:MAG: hypothetical protein WBZ29_05500 [Methanocella sp.]
MTMINRPLFLLLIVCAISICLLSCTPAARAAASSIVWVQPQTYYDETHVVPNDDDWVEYPLLRSGDTSGSSRVTFSIADQTIEAGNEAGQYELLGANPVVFSPGSTYALIRVRYHTANHDTFGTQHITFRLSDSDADIESDQETRTFYVDYPAAPALEFASPPDGGYRGVEGQGQAIILNVTRDGDVLVDSYADIFVSGTATNGMDFSLADASGRPVGIPGTIHLPPGQSVYSIYLTPLNDSNDEGNETATLTLGNIKNANAGDPVSVSVILYETGTVTPVSPTVPPVSTPSAKPIPTPEATPYTLPGTTPVPLPSPAPGLATYMIAVAIIATYIMQKKKM